MNVKVRAYRDADASATLEVFQQAIRCTAAAYYTAEQIVAWAPEDVDHAPWGARSAQAWTVVADVNGHVAGFCDLTDDGVLDMLFVHPNFGGHGVARALVQAVLAEATARGFTYLETHASRAARPVFEHLGFTVDAENPDNTINGVVVPNFDIHIALPRL